MATRVVTTTICNNCEEEIKQNSFSIIPLGDAGPIYLTKQVNGVSKSIVIPNDAVFCNLACFHTYFETELAKQPDA